MQIKDGKIIKFMQSFSSPLTGQWGLLEKTACFPESLPPALIQALEGKKKNDKVRISLPYLERMIYDEALIIKVKRETLTGAADIKIGMVFQTHFGKRQLQGVVKEMQGDSIIMDCNHPMAGEKNAVSDITIIEVRNPSEAEKNEPFIPSSRAI